MERLSETMAAIDKIYGTNHEYDEFRTWIYEHRKSYLKYFYPQNQGYERKEPRPICNMPLKADQWLFENCPLLSVRERILEQYDGEP